MKKLALIGLLSLITNSAYASFYQVECSNASTETQWNWGHVENSLTLTKTTFTDTVEKTPIKLALTDVSVETVESTVVAEERFDGCLENSNYTSWETTTVKKVIITKQDGSAFPVGISDLSDDQSSVETYLICKESGNSRVLCEQ